jgi:hypothetical protein
MSSWMIALRIWADYWISRCADPEEIEVLVQKYLMTVEATR